MTRENLDHYFNAYHSDFPFADENLGICARIRRISSKV